MSFTSSFASDATTTFEGFSPSAVATMRAALAAGRGRMAQFDHPELGGAGQWMPNGMLMIGDMGNDVLRARVARLCERLAAEHDEDASSRPAPNGSFQRQSQTAGGATHVQDSRRPEAAEWPTALGAPDTSGAQNGMRYAWFARARRLIVDDHGHRSHYDTGEHRISGVSQQQGDGSRLVFTSQHGPVDLHALPAAGDTQPGESAPERAPPLAATAGGGGDPFVAIERLADLHARGLVDAAEFAAKKAELLQRI